MNLKCDASAFALGSILYQKDDNNKRRAVAYHSKALNDGRKKLTLSEIENF